MSGNSAASKAGAPPVTTVYVNIATSSQQADGSNTTAILPTNTGKFKGRNYNHCCGIDAKLVCVGTVAAVAIPVLIGIAYYIWPSSVGDTVYPMMGNITNGNDTLAFLRPI